MKMKALKLVLLVLFALNFSCKSDDDDCKDDEMAIDFNIKIKLISASGDNLLDDDNFNIALLKLTDIGNAITNRDFNQITENGVELITFDALNMDSVNFVYDGVDKFYFGFQDLEYQTLHCNIQISNYKAIKLNGDLICDCGVNDTLLVTLEL